MSAAPTAEDGGKALRFYIFGTPVKMSPSPDIHNTGFASNGYPQYVYDRYDTPDAAEVMRVLRSEGTGGGSVTVPHKEDVCKGVDELSEAARSIGAVNTVTKLAGGRLLGENTDWLGIANTIRAKLPSDSVGAENKLVCLLCGAGGTARAACYALRSLGAARVLIFNRSRERAEGLAKEFGFEVCDSDLSAALASLERLDVVVSTLPGSAKFQLPEPAAAGALARFKPAVLEATYIPRRTPFLDQAIAAGCPIIEGIEMLFEQGCEQCAIWTKQPAPRQAIAEALLKALFGEGSAHPARAMMEPAATPPELLAVAAQKGRKRPREEEGTAASEA